MHGRLAALPATRGCLDLEQIQQFESKGVIDLDAESCAEELATLRDYLREALEKADAKLARRFWKGEDVVQLVHSRGWVVEQLLLLAWRRLVPFSADIGLIAVGGYGRGELHPNSDVDLLILLDEKCATPPTQQIEAFVQLLWDAGFYLGHSVRTVEQCAQDAAEDVVTATTFMESRLLAGSLGLLNGLIEATSAERIWEARSFFEAKFQEQQQRHERYHETAYNLEPNIKEGPGGLRDIQMISWVARRYFGSQTLHGLVEHDFISESEHRDLVGGQHLLWRIRYALHLLAGRAEDRLLFDFQRQIAERFGFTDSDTTLAVEQFMQLYYRTVMRLERLNESLLQKFQEALLFPGQDRIEELTDDFQARNGYVEPKHDQVFVRRPIALMELFVLLARDGDRLKGVAASTIREIRQHLYLVDDAFRSDPEVGRLLLELLRQPEGVYTQLQRMNRYGLLAALIPAFGTIVGRMQYDLFHVYTVDQHILFVVRNLRRFAYGKYAERFPHARSVFKRIAKPELLYLAAIFHDIAKGRGGDHSELGAVDAAAFCELLEIEPAEREMVAWLVEHHLAMSQTAQRKDLSDPQNIQKFAELVGNTRYLDHLYLLTVADIAGTSPKLWNNWKNKLLWELYLACGDALRRGLENPIKRATRIRETRAAALSRLLRRGLQAPDINRLWATLPEYAFWRLSPDQLEWTTETVVSSRDEAGCIMVRPVQPHGVSELLVCVPDHPGLFAAITATLDEMGLDVMSARVLTTNDDWSYDLFQLMDQHGNILNDIDAEELVNRLQVATHSDVPPAPVKRMMPRKLRHFEGTSKIHFTVDPDGEGTVLHLRCNDRPGLLSKVADAIYRQDVQVHNARIATFGERVEDTFLVSDVDHQPLTEEAKEALAGSIRQQLDND